jgi:hypothetical protein
LIFVFQFDYHFGFDRNTVRYICGGANRRESQQLAISPSLSWRGAAAEDARKERIGRTGARKLINGSRFRFLAQGPQVTLTWAASGTSNTATPFHEPVERKVVLIKVCRSEVTRPKWLGANCVVLRIRPDNPKY